MNRKERIAGALPIIAFILTFTLIITAIIYTSVAQSKWTSQTDSNGTFVPGSLVKQDPVHTFSSSSYTSSSDHLDSGSDYTGSDSSSWRDSSSYSSSDSGSWGGSSYSSDSGSYGGGSSSSDSGGW